MSNLRLPSLKWSDVHAFGSGTLAYATTADVTNAGAVIQHHGSTIALLAPQPNGGLAIAVTNAGWDSMTTTARMDRVLQDNGVPWRVVIRNGRTTLLTSDLSIAARGLERVTFVRTESDAAWGIASIKSDSLSFGEG